MTNLIESTQIKLYEFLWGRLPLMVLEITPGIHPDFRAKFCVRRPDRSTELQFFCFFGFLLVPLASNEEEV